MTRIVMSALVLTALVAVTAVPAIASSGGPKQAPPRYPVAITDEAELLRVFAAGLVGDAFGYDSNEVLYQVRASGMPTEDIAPTFHAAFLAGRNFMDVIERRAGGEQWGVIVHALGIDADMLNRMGVPSAVEFTDPRVVPDEVYEDMFVCGALARAFGVDPDDVFLFYEAGWSAMDLLAAVHIGYRTNQSFGAYLTGSPRRVDWYEQARRAGVSLGEVALAGGRVFDNMMPAMLDEPLRPDLELMYAEELARERWAVPASTIRHARYTYLYSPSELLISFHLADLGPYPYYRVGRLYAWDHRRLWGPTIVVLGIPSSHFRALPVWVGGRVDFYAVQPIALHHALLSTVLVWRTPLAVDFYYTRFDPWFWPPDAIVYYGVHRRHHVPFHDFYSWRRAGKPWHSYHYVGRDLGDFRRSLDWVGKRRVGTVIGHKQQIYGTPDPAWMTGGKVRYGAPPGKSAAPAPKGMVVGQKRWDDRRDGPTRQPAPVASPPGLRQGAPGGKQSPAPQPRAPGVTGSPGPKQETRPTPRTAPGVTISPPAAPGLRQDAPGGKQSPAPQPRMPEVTRPPAPVSGYQPPKAFTPGAGSASPAPWRPVPEATVPSRSSPLESLWKRWTGSTTPAPPAARGSGPSAPPARPSMPETVSPGGRKQAPSVAAPSPAQGKVAPSGGGGKGDGKRKR